MKKIAIIGGGASGMMAAIVATSHGARVRIYEHKDRVGKKILTTGNGKCNLTNLSLSKDDYRGNHPSFVVPVFEKFSVEDTLRFFEQLGLFWKEKNGYVYPVSNQAATVLDLLRFECKRLNIKIVTECGAVSIQPINGKKQEGFAVQDKSSKEKFDCVILATGSKAAPVTGSDGSGYKIAQKLGHSIVPVLPALTALKGKEEFFKPIAGVRVDATLSLYIENEYILSDTGELQLTAYGLSGIPVFQLSRYAIKAIKEKQKVHMVCDFLPGVRKKVLLEKIMDRKKLPMNAEEAFCGILNKKLLLHLLKQAQIKATDMVQNVSDDKLREFCGLIKQCKIPLFDYLPFENAQVCQGGVDTKELYENLESKMQKGLFIVGELVDIDGKCGGYNLQWAWSSGYVAGVCAAKKKGE